MNSTTDPSLEEPNAKRRRIAADGQGSTTSTCVTRLPDHVLGYCFSFLGPGHYRYVAGTCHAFRDAYVYSSKTTWESAATSVSCSALCLRDEEQPVPSSRRRRQKPLDIMALAAARMGRVEVLEWAYGHGYDKYDGWTDMDTRIKLIILSGSMPLIAEIFMFWIGFWRMGVSWIM